MIYDKYPQSIRERVQAGGFICSTYLWYNPKYGNCLQKKVIACYVRMNWRRKVRNNYYCVLASFLYVIIWYTYGGVHVQELVLASFLYVMLYGGVQQLTYETYDDIRLMIPELICIILEYNHQDSTPFGVVAPCLASIACFIFGFSLAPCHVRRLTRAIRRIRHSRTLFLMHLL